MKRENSIINDDIKFYGITEASVVEYLRNHLKCLEEEYDVRFLLKEEDEDHTIGKFVIDYANVFKEKRKDIESVMESLMPALLSYGQHQYIEQQLMKKKLRMKDDPLTGVFNREYLMDRAEILRRAEIYPTTVIAAKLKGWKHITDNYGIQSGDSLIQLAASILAKEADKDFLIGRMEADIFVILIPLVRDGEMEAYCSRIRAECEVYKDSLFAPEIDLGITATHLKNEDVTGKIREAMEMIA